MATGWKLDSFLEDVTLYLAWCVSCISYCVLRMTDEVVSFVWSLIFGNADHCTHIDDEKWLAAVLDSAIELNEAETDLGVKEIYEGYINDLRSYQIELLCRKEANLTTHKQTAPTDYFIECETKKSTKVELNNACETTEPQLLERSCPMSATCSANKPEKTQVEHTDTDSVYGRHLENVKPTSSAALFQSAICPAKHVTRSFCSPQRDAEDIMITKSGTDNSGDVVNIREDDGNPYGVAELPNTAISSHAVSLDVSENISTSASSNDAQNVKQGFFKKLKTTFRKKGRTTKVSASPSSGKGHRVVPRWRRMLCCTAAEYE